MTAFLETPKYFAIRPKDHPLKTKSEILASSAASHFMVLMPSIMMATLCTIRMMIRIETIGAATSAIDARLNTVRKRRIKPFRNQRAFMMGEKV